MTRAERLPSTVRWPSLAFFVLGANLLVTLPLARALNLWQDEAYTLHTTGAGVAYAFTQAIGFEQNAPLYFVIISLWRHFGDGIFFLRLFSVLCIAATVLLVPAIARRYLPAQNPLWVTAVVACNPFVVWAAVEMRVYAAIVLLSALLLLTFFDAFCKERPSAWAMAAYAVCTAAALYTQYYLAFLIAAQGLTLLVCHRGALWRFLLAAAGATVAFLPMLAIVPGQVQNFKDGFQSPSLVHAATGLAGILLRYVLPVPARHARLDYAAAGAAVALALVIARPSLAKPRDRTILVMAASAASLFAAGTYLAGVHVLDRHAASLYLPATIGVFALFSSFSPSLERRAAAGWSCVAIALSLVVLGGTYAAMAKPGDWARVASYLRFHESANEPIVVFEAENALPLTYYYRGANRIVPIPQPVDFRRYEVPRFVIRDEAELVSTMPPQQRIWLVTAGECTSSNIQFGCATLERFVAQRYRVVSDAEFYGARVRLLARNRS